MTTGTGDGGGGEAPDPRHLRGVLGSGLAMAGAGTVAAVLFAWPLVAGLIRDFPAAVEAMTAALAGAGAWWDLVAMLLPSAAAAGVAGGLISVGLSRAVEGWRGLSAAGVRLPTPRATHAALFVLGLGMMAAALQGSGGGLRGVLEGVGAALGLGLIAAAMVVTTGARRGPTRG